MPDVKEVETLLRMPGLDVVYIATPPFLHHPQAMQALQAGKHVLVEKPTALHPAQADEMLAAAHERGLLLATNLMQRYNPLFDSIRGLLERKPLGELLHAYFENYACDEDLPADHWFWDRSKSGGIFVEHGVHFFDLFAGWLGPGRVEAAQVCLRPAPRSKIRSSARCATATACWSISTTASLSSAAWTARNCGWSSSAATCGSTNGYPSGRPSTRVVDEADTRTLCELFPDARLDVTAWYCGKDRICSGRHKALDVYQMVEMSYGQGDLKMHRYGELVRDLLADQLAWIEDRRHVRRITEQNGTRRPGRRRRGRHVGPCGDAKLVNS